MTLHALLGIPEREKRIVSLCGSGGKTTLMYALARESARETPTAIFTTTHIYPPSGEDVCLLEPFDEEECRRVWSRGKIAAAGTFLPNERKFSPPSEEAAAFLYREGGAVFVESDGSRRLPLKYPGPWEPVIPSEATHIVTVAGMSALGRPAEEVIHRLALAREKMPIPAGPVTAETMAELLWAGYGRFSPVFLLNQADDPETAAAGQRVADLLREKGAARAAVVSLLSLSR